MKAIIIGAGHAGLSASYYLTKAGIDHVVLEKGKVGESWRSQRWDSFVMNSNNRMTLLPGQQTNDPEGFLTRDEFTASLETYIRENKLPIREGVTVQSVKQNPGGGFEVLTSDESGLLEYETRNVIVCSGKQNIPLLPELAQQVPEGIFSMHAAAYRNPDQLRPGAVLVVGSAQSGCQIAEDLLESGRQVLLATSRLGRLPRRYRGADILEWLDRLKFFNTTLADVKDPSTLKSRAPQLTGVGATRTISLQSLEKRGVTLLGRLAGFKSGKLIFNNDLPDNLKAADTISAQVKAMIDGYIASNEVDAPASVADDADRPVDPEQYFDAPMQLPAASINNIIWATGFTGDFSFLEASLLDQQGMPLQVNGKGSVAGLYYLGFAWIRNRKSGLVAGITEDAKLITDQVIHSAASNVKERQLI